MAFVPGSLAHCRRGYALALALSTTLLPTISRAEPSRIAIVRSAKADKLGAESAARLEGELRAAGFDVITLQARPGLDARAQVEAERVIPPPFATISINATKRGAVADVWVADHLSGKTLVRRVDVMSSANDGAPALPSVLAVRAVELLRASLVELSLPRTKNQAPALPTDVAAWLHEGTKALPTPAPLIPIPRARQVLPEPPPPLPTASASSLEPIHATGPAAAPPQAIAPASPTESGPAPAKSTPRFLPIAVPSPTTSSSRLGFRVEAAFAQLWSTGGAGPSLGPSLEGALTLERWSFGLWGTGPFWGADTSAPQGGATIRQEAASVVLGYEATHLGNTVLSVRGSAGLYHARAEGSAREPNVALTTQVWAGVATVGTELSGPLAESWSLFGRAAMGAVLPNPVFLVGTERSGGIGPAIVLSDLGIRYHF